MRKSRNNIRKRRISKRRRSIYGGQGKKGVKSCPNESEIKQWKYGDNCYESCDATSDDTFPVSWDDEHDQRRCEADTPENRRRYNLLVLPASTAYKGYRVGRDAAVYAKDTAVSAYNTAAPYAAAAASTASKGYRVGRDAAIAAKDTAVSAYHTAAPYAVAAKDAAVAAKDKAVSAYNFAAPYASAAKDKAVRAYNYVAPKLFPPREDDDDDEGEEYGAFGIH